MIERFFRTNKNTQEVQVNPPSWDETPMVQKEAEIAARIYIETLIFKEEKRAKGCGCNNCFKDASRLKEQWQ